jgi:hypothetical protein
MYATEGAVDEIMRVSNEEEEHILKRYLQEMKPTVLCVGVLTRVRNPQCDWQEIPPAGARHYHC